MIISLLFAMDENNAIGKDNGLPWHLPADLKYFKKLTTGHTIAMGRKTYESIGRPLPNRTNVVLTRGDYKAEGVIVKNSVQEAIDFAKENGEDELFFIGGAEIANAVLPVTDRFYLTRIHSKFEADTFLPFNETKWTVTHEEHHKADEKNAYDYTFYTLEKK